MSAVLGLAPCSFDYHETDESGDWCSVSSKTLLGPGVGALALCTPFGLGHWGSHFSGCVFAVCRLRCPTSLPREDVRGLTLDTQSKKDIPRSDTTRGNCDVQSFIRVTRKETSQWRQRATENMAISRKGRRRMYTSTRPWPCRSKTTNPPQAESSRKRLQL